MRREARIRTWRSENFFSSSRVRLVGLSVGSWNALGGFGGGGFTAAAHGGNPEGMGRGQR